MNLVTIPTNISQVWHNEAKQQANKNPQDLHTFQEGQTYIIWYVGMDTVSKARITERTEDTVTLEGIGTYEVKVHELNPSSYEYVMIDDTRICKANMWR